MLCICAPHSKAIWLNIIIQIGQGLYCQQRVCVCMRASVERKWILIDIEMSDLSVVIVSMV